MEDVKSPITAEDWHMMALNRRLKGNRHDLNGLEALALLSWTNAGMHEEAQENIMYIQVLGNRAGLEYKVARGLSQGKKTTVTMDAHTMTIPKINKR